jgi:tetratricopeptide (TPR) repeat protein
MKLIVLVAATCALVAGDGVARADAAREDRARQLYQAGRDAYNGGDFQKAYDAFKESFTLSHQPALLYNVASALQGLRRPHDAAEALRSYLRLKPDDVDRPQIEERIRTLEEEQRLIDLENRDKSPTPAAPTPTPIAPVAPPTATPTTTSNSLTASAPAHEKERMRKRTALIVGITAGVVVVAGVAIGLAFGLQPKEQPLTQSAIGPIKSTE